MVFFYNLGIQIKLLKSRCDRSVVCVIWKERLKIWALTCWDQLS